MRDFIITTDNTTDLPQEYFTENDIKYMVLPCTIDGATYDGSVEFPYKEFYSKMRNGSMPKTSQVNPETSKAFFEKNIAQGYNILHLAFSSGLSGSYNSAVIAADEIMEENKDAKIIVVDSLCASLGEGLFVHLAVEMKKKGVEMEAIASWAEENKSHLCHNFTVDDLNHLFRGGRVSRATAIVGTMINIKPILHVDNEGHLVAIGKVRGRKKSLTALVDRMEEQLGKYRNTNQTVFISHGDCYEDAVFVRDLVKERFGYNDFLINTIGATIGAHAGPGTVALFFMGEYR